MPSATWAEEALSITGFPGKPGVGVGVIGVGAQAAGDGAVGTH